MTRLLGSVLVVLVVVAPPAAAQTFLSVSEDVPLMTELREDLDAALVFDTPDGRIVEAAAVGAVSAAQIRSFYASTLPQLGWDAVATGRFRRDTETLTIEIADVDAGRLVRFRFAPAP